MRIGSINAYISGQGAQIPRGEPRQITPKQKTKDDTTETVVAGPGPDDGRPGRKAQLTYYDAADFPCWERPPSAPKPVTNASRPRLQADLARSGLGTGQNARGTGRALPQQLDDHRRPVDGPLRPDDEPPDTDRNPRSDLYCLQEDGAWTFVNSARPSGKQNEAVIITDMEPAEREYMLYLPLYDGLTDLEIGIDSLARIEQPAVDLPAARTSRGLLRHEHPPGRLRQPPRHGPHEHHLAAPEPRVHQPSDSAETPCSTSKSPV